MHTFVGGATGFGKSTFARVLAESAHQEGLKSIRIVDPKADEYLPLAQKYSDFIVLKWNDLRFNPLLPPPNVPKTEWYQTIIGHLSQCFNFWQGAESYFLRHIEIFEKSGKEITLSRLLQNVLSEKSRFGQKDAMIKSTVVSRLEMMNILFGDIINTNSTMLEALSKKNIIILTTGLMAESDSWLTEFMLLWEYTYRVYNPDKRNLAMHIYDECQHRLFSSEKEKKIQKTSSALISKLVDQCRAMNIGICSLSQEPSTLLKVILNNSYLKIVFHLGSGSEIRVAAEALGLDSEQAKLLHYLEVGEAIVRTAGEYMDAIPVKFDNFEPADYCTPEEFCEYQNELKSQLLENSIIKEGLIPAYSAPKIIASNDVLDDEGVLSAADEIIKEKEAIYEKEKSEKAEALEKVENTSNSKSAESEDNDLPILSIWLNLPNVFLTQGEIFEKAGISSGSTQAKIKKELLRNNLIIDHKVQCGKTYSSIWEPTEKAYEVIGKQKPKYKSKGGYLHQFLAHRIKNWGQENGLLADIEFRLSNNKAVDLVFRKGKEVFFVEVAVSPPLEKEINNLIKDLKTDLQPNKVVVAAIDNKTKRGLEELIESSRRLEDRHGIVKVVLAGDFLAKNKKPI
jgi:hypothetical protein